MKEPETLKEKLDYLVDIYKQKSPIRCRNVGTIIRARDEFEVWLSKGKTVDQIAIVIAASEIESLPWEATMGLKYVKTVTPINPKEDTLNCINDMSEEEQIERFGHVR